MHVLPFGRRRAKRQASPKKKYNDSEFFSYGPICFVRPVQYGMESKCPWQARSSSTAHVPITETRFRKWKRAMLWTSNPNEESYGRSCYLYDWKINSAALVVWVHRARCMCPMLCFFQVLRTRTFRSAGCMHGACTPVGRLRHFSSKFACGWSTSVMCGSIVTSWGFGLYILVK